MSLKDILAPIFSLEADEPALAAAEAIGEAMAAHVTALLIEPEPDPVYTLEGVMVSSMWADVLARSRREFAAEKAKLDQRILRSAQPAATRELATPLGFVGRDASVAARYADLTIMLRPGQDDVRVRLFEAVLFGSGRPVLLTPPNWRKGPIGRSIVIAWNGKREAARAVADAAAFLQRAEKITIVTVGADKNPSAQGEADDLAAHFGRCGMTAGVRIIGDLGFTETAT